MNNNNTRLIALFVCAGIFSASARSECSSISAVLHGGGWKPVKTAPHDGTVVELMQTYGIAPWFDIFRWTKEQTIAFSTVCDINGKCHVENQERHITLSRPTWVSVDRPGHSMDEDECVFWRPYTGKGEYKDPTGGAQNTKEYWLRAIGHPDR